MIEKRPSSTTIEQPPLPLDSFVDDEGTARLAAILISLALVAEDGVDISEVAELTATTCDRIEEAIEWHADQPHQGIVLLRQHDLISIASSPHHAAYIRRYLRLDREAKLTAAALEALAIVAYQQPTTRAEIDAVRGVDSSGVLANLHNRGLVESVGKRGTIGSPIEYGTTVEFLRLFGLRTLNDLPPLGVADGRDLAAALEAAIASTDASAEDRPLARASDVSQADQAGGDS